MPNPTSPSTAEAAADRSFFGHPRGLSTLFFTEFWERFSYYGIRAILTVFMTTAAAAGGLGFSEVRAGAIYGLFTAGVYLLALPGGWVADQLLGQRRSVFVGGLFIALGNFLLYAPLLSTFYLGLLSIVIGTGLLKPNVSTMVGELYPGTTAEDGARRDAAFSIFYMGINLGALIAPLVCSYVGERIDFHLGFLVAGIGMLCGLVQYKLGGRKLGQAGLHPNAAGNPEAQRRAYLVLLGGSVGAVIIGYVLIGILRLTVETLAGAMGVVIVSLALLYLVLQLVSPDLDRTEKKRMGVIFILFLFSATFWSGFEQAGSSLTLFAQRLTDRHLFGWEMPVGYLQSVNPILIIALAPVFAWLWVALSKRKLEPSAPAKFSLGLILVGLGFGVMVWASILTRGQTHQVGLLWLNLTYLFHTCGELCLSPVGLSTVTKLAPHRKVGQMMGIWFMSIALGNLTAGLVAGQFATLPLPQLFGAVTAITIGAGLILALLIKPIRRLMSGVH
ncbi:MAG TPA: peptide MFS transporter [Thermoanaerobaculia bacterium]|nr:peptide MFS transporter [Thermoanaerobaculia bacterium]